MTIWNLHDLRDPQGLQGRTDLEDLEDRNLQDFPDLQDPPYMGGGILKILKILTAPGAVAVKIFKIGVFLKTLF